jgi:hypothetical protein
MYDDGWTNERLQADPQGYLAAQRREREQAERERKEAREQSDFEQSAPKRLAPLRRSQPIEGLSE